MMGQTSVKTTDTPPAACPLAVPSRARATGARPRTRLLVAIVLLPLLLQAAFLALLPDRWRQPLGDDYVFHYAPIAQSILSDGAISNPIVGGGVATVYPPGYPLILALIFWLADVTGIERPALITVFNVGAMAATTLLVFLIAELMFGTRIGAISAVLWISYPFNLWLSGHPYAETPFLLFLYSGVWLFTLALAKGRPRLIPLVGIALGLAALVRPIGLLLGLHLAVLLLFHRTIPRRIALASATLLLAGFLVTIAPWEVYVFSSTGRLIPLSTNGPASIVDGLTFALKPGPPGDGAPVPSDVRRLMERIATSGPSLATTGGILGYLAQETIRDPMPVAKLAAIKLARSWYGTNTRRYEQVILAIQAVYLGLMLGGIGLALRIHRHRLFWMLCLLSLLVYFWGMTVAALSIVRYMVPAVGLNIIFAAILVDGVMRRLPRQIALPR